LIPNHSGGEPEVGLSVLLMVLVLIWVVALAPIAYRRYAERQASTSVDRFRQRITKVRHAYPAVGMTEMDFAARPRVDRRIDLQAQVAKSKARLHGRRMRRRRVLTGLLVVVAGSLVLGAVPALRVLWFVSFAVGMLTAAYMALLVSIARSETLELERLRKIVPFGIHQTPVYDEQVAAVGGNFIPLFASPMTQRPAFVVLEAPTR
jgi:ABC-type transport system involved in cytochrome bd biosynthesis fused ATPase/permease subunit